MPIARFVFLATALVLSTASCSKQGQEPSPVVVRVTRARRHDLVRTIHVPGGVRAYYQATLFSQVAGYVRAMRFDKGDHVREGDVIAQVDAPEVVSRRDMQAARLEQAKADVSRAKVDVEAAVGRAAQSRAELSRSRAIAELKASLHERAKALRDEEDISIQDLEIAAGERKAADAGVEVARAKREVAAAEVDRANAAVGVAEAAADAARAELRSVEALLEFTRIRAPFDGVVTARFVDPGALLQRATRDENALSIVSVATRGRVRVDFEVPEAEVAHVASGTLVDVLSDSWPGERFRGQVARVASALDPASRTMLCEAELANERDQLLSGMYVRVRVELEVHRDAVALPAEAFFELRGETFVAIVVGSVARRVRVVEGFDLGEEIEVARGLRGGELVVLGQGAGLADGTRVEPAPDGDGTVARRKGTP